jgi:polyketide cyclase/dehydrase/lipid transport protein
MASIYRQFELHAPAALVWDAIRDIGAVHERLAKGFVVNTVAEGNTRTVTFANGFVVQEEILAVDDINRRLAYRSVGGRASHHNAYFQVFDDSPKTARVIWVTDLLPEAMQAPIEQMMDQGIRAIQQTFGSEQS